MKSVRLLIWFSFFSVYLFGQQPTVKDSVNRPQKQGIIVIGQDRGSKGKIISDSLIMETTFTQTRYYFKNRRLNYSIVKKILVTNEEVVEYVSLANSYRIISDVFMGSGIIAVCFSGIYAIDRNDPTIFYRGAVFGGVLITVSIPFQISFTRNMHKAIDVFNRDLKLADNHIDLNIKMTSTGIGLVLNF